MRNAGHATLEAMADDIRERLEAILADHIPARDDLTPAGELQAILAMPPAIRAAITERLEAISRFLEDPGTARADQEAARLGMKRRNFYNLIARLRLDGPSRALSPSKAGFQRKPTLGDELGDIVERSIAETLSERPEATASMVVASVQRECEFQGIKPPSDRTIRQRLAAHRSDPSAPTLRDNVLGREIFIDQSAASFVLQDESGDSLGLVTLIVDAGTRLILGIGAGSSGAPDSGLKRAIEDWENRKASLPFDLFEWREWPESIHWIIPDRFLDEARQWGRTAAINDVSALLTSHGARRHGGRLLKSIGANLGWLRFLPRSTGEGAVSESLGPKFPRFDRQSAQEAVAILADAWNDAVARAKGPARGSEGLILRARAPYGLEWTFESLRIVCRSAEAWDALQTR